MNRYTVVRATPGESLMVVPWADGRGGAAIPLGEALVEDLPSGRDWPETGDVVELEIDSGTAIGRYLGTATLVKLTHRGATWHVKGQPAVALPYSQFGVTRNSDGDALERAEFWLGSADGPLKGQGHFANADAFLAKRAADQEASERARAERARARAEGARTKYRTDRFNNPYNFVPLPDVPAPRSRPCGHLGRDAARLSGTITVNLEARTPLLLRTDDGQTGVPKRDGQPMIPASALKGALRSLHETFTGSCYRVVDLDFAPGYRDVMKVDNKAEKDGWRLAVVSEVDRHGKPVALTICDQAVWVQMQLLYQALGARGIESGARLAISGTPTPGPGGRLEVRPGGDCQVTANPEGSYVLMVTDTAARPKDKQHLFVCGRISEESVRPHGEVWEDAWQRYRNALANANDAGGRRENRDRSAPKKLSDLLNAVAKGSKTPDHPHVEVRRFVGTESFFPGYLLWVKLDGGNVTELSLAHTWRHPGTNPVRDRLPAGFHPCQDADELCPSCAMFGSAPTAGAKKGPTQVAYRGHIRFLDLVATQAKVEPECNLAPMGAPKPSAGNFYLAHDEEQSRPGRADLDKPSLREWGSARDDTSVRLIRGRKFYWHTTPRKADPRYLLADHQGAHNAGRSSKSAHLIAAGARFSGRIVFEDLSPAQLGSLLVVLQPGLALAGRSGSGGGGQAEEPHFCWHVGGGRPLGLGSVSPVEPPQVELDAPGGARYLEVPPSRASAELINSWVQAFIDSLAPSVRATWPALAALLALDHVNPETVRYPSIAEWPDDPAHRATWAGELSLKWWKPVGGPDCNQPGMKQRDEATYLVLPNADAADPALPIDPLEELT